MNYTVLSIIPSKSILSHLDIPSPQVSCGSSLQDFSLQRTRNLFLALATFIHDKDLTLSV